VVDPEDGQLSARVGNYDWLAITMLDVIGRLDEIEVTRRGDNAWVGIVISGI